MSITTTEIVSDSDVGTGRWVTYRCQDHLGEWHRWGPVWAEYGWDADAFKPTIAARVAEKLAAVEAELLLGGD